MPARTPSIWLAIPSVLIATLVWTNNDFPLDYWWHVNHGRWMVEHGQWVTQDYFSHTIFGEPVRNQPWLSQLVMFGFHSLGGYALNQFVAGLTYAAAVGLLTWLVWRRTDNDRLAGLWGVAAVAIAASNLGVRPQCFSWLLFVSEWLLLLRVRRTFQLALGCGLIAMLWTNVHGAFPLAVITPGLFAVAAWWDGGGTWRHARFQRFAASTMAAAAGAVVRPVPAGVCAYVWNVSSRAVERGIEEWLPTTSRDPSGAAMFAVLLVSLVILARSSRRITNRDLAALVLFLIPALSSQRMMIWWSVVCPLAMSRISRGVWLHWGGKWATSHARPAERRPWSAWELPAAIFAAGLALCVSSPWARPFNPLLPPAKRMACIQGEPRELADWLTRVVTPTRSLAPLTWSSFFSWHTRGRLQSFVDSRVDYFPDRVWCDYVRMREGTSGALRLLDDYCVDVVICERQQTRLKSSLSESERWHVVFEDGLGMIFARRTDAAYFGNHPPSGQRRSGFL